MRDFENDAGGGKSFLDVVALEVDVGIDLVGDAIIALISLEADVVCGGADPESLAVDVKRRFPNAQVIAGGDNRNRLGVGPAIILRASEKVELTHGHRQIGFLGKALENAVEDSFLDVGVDFDPAGHGEGALHRGFRAEEQKIDHVSGIAGLVRDTPRDFMEKGIINAREGSDLTRDDASGSAGRSVDLNADGVCAIGRIVFGLIDADGEAAGNRGDYVATRANEEWLGRSSVANAADERTAARVVKRQDAKKVPEAAGVAFRAIVFLRVGVAELSGSGDEDGFAGLNIHAGVRPKLIACELKFLREPQLAGRSRSSGNVLFAGDRSGRRVSYELSGQARWRQAGAEEKSHPKSDSCWLTVVHEGKPSHGAIIRIFTVSRCVCDRQALAGPGEEGAVFP